MRPTTIITFVFAFLAPPSSFADTHPSTLKVAVIDDVPSTQMATQLMETAYKQLGIDMTTIVAPSRRALLLADSGQVDGDLFRIHSVAEEYPNLVQTPYPLLQGKLYAVVHDPGIRTLPKAKDAPLLVAVRRGIIISEITAKSLGMEPVPAEDYEQMRNMLEQKRVALALVADVEGLSPLTRSDWKHLTALPEPVAEFQLYHYLHRRHEKLAQSLAEVLERLDREGVKEEIRERVVGDFQQANN